MARYRNAKGKINRRLGAQIYESGGAVRAFDRRPEPPGMHARPRKLSTYGQGLIEKQKKGQNFVFSIFSTKQRSTQRFQLDCLQWRCTKVSLGTS